MTPSASRRLPPRRSGYKTPKGSEEERKVEAMSVASVTEISAVFSEGFEEAIREGINRATSTLRNVEGAWVKDKNVLIENGSIVGYKVNLLVTFVMDDAQGETGRDTSVMSSGQEPPQ